MLLFSRILYSTCNTASCCNICPFRHIISRAYKAAIDDLRSWVHLPPSPFLTTRELRHYFELNLVNVGQKPLAMPMPYPPAFADKSSNFYKKVSYTAHRRPTITTPILKLVVWYSPPVIVLPTFLDSIFA